jgi:hypothetical protein
LFFPWTRGRHSISSAENIAVAARKAVDREVGANSGADSPSPLPYSRRDTCAAAPAGGGRGGAQTSRSRSTPSGSSGGPEALDSCGLSADAGTAAPLPRRGAGLRGAGGPGGPGLTPWCRRSRCRLAGSVLMPLQRRRGTYGGPGPPGAPAPQHQTAGSWRSPDAVRAAPDHITPPPTHTPAGRPRLQAGPNYSSDWHRSAPLSAARRSPPRAARWRHAATAMLDC